MGTVNRYCIDCGARLTYYPTLSNPKAPNEHRILTYACPDCTKDFDKPKLLSINRSKETDPINAVRVTITEPKD